MCIRDRGEPQRRELAKISGLQAVRSFISMGRAWESVSPPLLSQVTPVQGVNFPRAPLYHSVYARGVGLVKKIRIVRPSRGFLRKRQRLSLDTVREGVSVRFVKCQTLTKRALEGEMLTR